MPKDCGCGGSRRSGGTGTKYQVVDATNKVVNTYSDKTDARQQASILPGARVRAV